MTTRPANRRWPQDIGFFFSIACFSAGVVCTFVLRNHDEPSDSSVVCTIFLLIMVFFTRYGRAKFEDHFRGFKEAGWTEEMIIQVGRAQAAIAGIVSLVCLMTIVKNYLAQ